MDKLMQQLIDHVGCVRAAKEATERAEQGRGACAQRINELVTARAAEIAGFDRSCPLLDSISGERTIKKEISNPNYWKGKDEPRYKAINKRVIVSLRGGYVTTHCQREHYDRRPVGYVTRSPLDVSIRATNGDSVWMGSEGTAQVVGAEQREAIDKWDAALDQACSEWNKANGLEG